MRMKTLLLILAVLCTGYAHAQNACADYHKYNCLRGTDKRFSPNGQSRSAPVQVGVPTELNIIVYRGQDYRISLCADARILGEQLSIRIVEKIRQPREVQEEVSSVEQAVDEDGQATGEMQETRTTRTRREYEEVEKVLWDNAEHDMVQEVEFSSTATKRIAIQVVAPGSSGKQRRSEKGMDIGCVGILIEHMPTPGLGF